MKRSWAVRPDETGTVSRQALVDAFVDAATILDLAGGCLEVVVGRAPTNVPGEMVMTGAVLCWKDRTDAKAQPEVAQAVVPLAVAPPAEPVNEEAKAQFMAEMDAIDADLKRTEPASNDQPESEPVGPEPDGFDYSKLEEEDIEEPAVAR